VKEKLMSTQEARERKKRHRSKKYRRKRWEIPTKAGAKRGLTTKKLDPFGVLEQ